MAVRCFRGFCINFHKCTSADGGVVVALNAMYEHYQQLQNQFKTVHKEVDQLRASKSRPGELRREISQLEEESQQLTEKIAN